MLIGYLCFFPEHGIFGVPLQVMLEYDQKLQPSVKIPLAFEEV